MVVVIDTSVFVSALLGPGGASRAVLRACLEKQVDPLIGTALYLEYESLLARETLFERSALTPNEREALLNAYLSVCRWVEIYFLWRPNLPDEADNHLVELAVAGGAEWIVTKNVRDFQRAELAFPRLRVLKPEEAIKEIAKWAR